MRNELEEELSWEVVLASNSRIGKFLDFTPEIEYSVGSKELGSYVFTPKNCVEWSMSSGEQKAECEKWIKNQREKYPESEFSHPSYEALRQEWYPQFHRDWNALHTAVAKLKEKDITIDISDIETTWKRVYINCFPDDEQIKWQENIHNKNIVWLVADTLEMKLHACFDSSEKANKYAAGLAFCTVQPIEVK